MTWDCRLISLIMDVLQMMSVSVALYLISSVAQPRLLQLADFLLYSPEYGIEGIFLQSGLKITEVCFVEMTFLFQNLHDIMAVLIKSVLVLSDTRL